MIELIFNKL